MKIITLVISALAFMFVSTASAQWQKTSASDTSKIYCLAASGSTIFAGSYNNGMFRSLDSGVTWASDNSGLTNPSIYSIGISGTNIFAGTWGGGAFLSTNNGSSWSAINALPASYISAFSIQGSNIVAATSQGMFLSSDNGGTWAAIDSGLTDSYMISVIQNGNNWMAGDYFGGVFLSTDNGQFWNATGIGAGIIYSFASMGTNIFGGTWAQNGGVFLTQDTGTTWTTLDSGLTFKNIHALAINGSNILAGSDSGGVYLSTLANPVWATFNTGGLTGAHIYSLLINGPYIYAGTANGQVWRRRLSDLIACTPVVTASDYSVCQGSSATLTASSGSAYLWNTGETTQSIVVNTPGAYSCSITTICGVLTSNAVVLTVKPLPVATVTASGPTTFCKTSTSNVVLTASGGVDYIWSIGGTGATAQSITVKTTQTDSVTVIGANGCKATSAPIAVVVNAFPVITSQPKKDTVFAGCMRGQFLVGASGTNLTYQWQVNVGSGFSNLSNAGIYSGANTDTLTLSSAVAIMNGYSYHCIISNGGCMDTTASVALTVKTAKIVSQTDTLCAGDSIIVGMHTYSTSGTYVDTLKSIIACDSIYLTSNLVFDSIITHSQSVSICSGGSFTVGSFTHNSAGTFHDTLQNGKGCDSIVTTVLSVKAPVKTTQTLTLCAGDTAFVGNNVHIATGTYIDTLTTFSTGCDSVVTTHLAIDSTIKRTLTLTLCSGDSVTVGVHTYHTSGQFVDTLQNGRGCDSIVTTKLAIDAVIKSSQTVSICFGNTITVGSHTYDTTGVYVDTLSAGIGCDSIVTTHLTANLIKSTQTISICFGDSITVGSFMHDTTGTFNDTLRNGSGCDSVITTHLTINPVIQDSASVVLCPGDSVIVGMHTYKTPGRYIDTFTTTGGCDSIFITNLSIRIITTSQTLNLCAGNTVTVGMQTHDTSGTYIDTLMTLGGCDSIVTTHLSYVTDVVLHGDTLTAKTSPAIVEWFNCDNRDSILATGQSFTPLEYGSYAAIITVSSCSDTSACFTVSPVGIAVIPAINYSVILYPNPANDQLNIRTPSLLANEMLTVSVMNVVGEIMQEEKLKWSRDVSINISNLPAGMYFLQIRSLSGSSTKRFIKD